MEHTPPPFFKRGPAPTVRLALFASLSLALLVMDARFHYVEGLRRTLSVIAYPLQQLATVPIVLGQRAAEYFATQSALREENAVLRARLLDTVRDAQRFEAAEAEAAQLRRLIGAAERVDRAALPAQILYTGRDPYALRIVLDKGTRDGVEAGSPVIDGTGVVGQVTRAHPLLSEVTLITDKDQAVPVQVLRNGLRAVAFGAGPSGELELRFIAANADIVPGDRLVTSGIDGTYPPGLPVATVLRVEADPSQPFSRVACRPLAGVDRGRFALVLSPGAKPPPYPEEPAQRKGARKARRLSGTADGSR